jgi:hypothetical protein
MGILIFKGLTARPLYKSFGVKGLIFLYFPHLPKNQPTVNCFHSHWSITSITCPVLQLFNHLITIVNMLHCLSGLPEDVCSKLLQNIGACVPVCTTSYPSRIPWNLHKHCRHNLDHPPYWVEMSRHMLVRLAEL